MSGAIRRQLSAVSIFTALMIGALAAGASAQGQVPAGIAQMSIEELMKIEVTSVSRKPERAVDVAAAVYVITQEQIRRSGLTTIPDLLRMAPGVDVAQVNANRWAVSVRGFNAVYANKLLVLIDGRSIYTRIFSGVVWDAVNLPLEDVDRIEVIRGPGATVWGANAVNGVINIVTKVASETLGGRASVELGGPDQATVRYGWTRGAAAYRVHAQWTNWRDTELTSGVPAGDRSQGVTAGFRVDVNSTVNSFTIDGDIIAGRTRALWLNLAPQVHGPSPFITDPSDAVSGHLLGQWKRSGKALSFQLRSYVQLDSRDEPIGHATREAVDVDAVVHALPLGRHDIVGGAGYRRIEESFAGRSGLLFVPERAVTHLTTAFLHDAIAIGSRVTLTLGSQLQYDSRAGGGVQPTARVLWKAGAGQQLWAAASRALRTPSLWELGARTNLPATSSGTGLPTVVTILGNPEARTETFADVEAGYRAEVGHVATIDITAFEGRYQHLISREIIGTELETSGTPHVRITALTGNELSADTRGVELAAQWAVLPAWRLQGTFTGFRLSAKPSAFSRDPAAAGTDGNAPRQQWQLASTWSPVPRLTLYAALFYVGALRQLQIDSHSRTDVTVEWRVNSRLAATAVGRNLFEQHLPEYGGALALAQATHLPRTVGVRLRWTF